ncbi:MAG: beta-ketoacyl-[acyl-carrier-protein] synthase family protein [Planctomycetaceae bacterium]|jgi:3-oxoacyl-[acyl-carrier-protein] synthase II|nr:MAG: beta-ketoacyl-[acyl-carrier-protein] synthase family protein [Planctomycetaceae bacterium]
MRDTPEVVITGIGIVSSIGIGQEAFWKSLLAGSSGVKTIEAFDASSLPVRFGAHIPDFDPKLYIRPRKSLKVMSREIQMGFAAADMAMIDASLATGTVDPDRFGVVFGSDMIYADLEDLEGTYRRCITAGHFDFSCWAEAAAEELQPLWLLKHLPNMTASHIAIAQDARGPNNSIVLGDVSSLLAISEATSVIQRGWADVMLVGGSGCRLHPNALVARGDGLLSHRSHDFQKASRPFDRDRDGLVNGEGAGVFVLESLAHAKRRGGRIHARILGTASRCESRHNGTPLSGRSLVGVIQAILRNTSLTPNDIGHINAHGASSIEVDRVEAAAIAATLGDIPVTAPKSFFGHLGAGSGVTELAVSILGIEHGVVPYTLNYDHPDPLCPVNVVHNGPLRGRPPVAISLNLASTGQAAAVMIAAAE